MRFKCKPSSHGMFIIGKETRVSIILKPKQVWEFYYSVEDDVYVVTRDNVSISLTSKDFNTYFVKLGWE